MKKVLATTLVITIAALGCACSKDSKIDSQAEDKAAVETTTEETTTKETSEATTEETTEETTETTISSEELYQKYVEEIAIDCVESKEVTGENAKLFEEPLPLKCTYYYSDDPFEWTAVYLYPSNEDALNRYYAAEKNTNNVVWVFQAGMVTEYTIEKFEIRNWQNR